MSRRVTKSKHIDKYCCFFKYDEPGDIPFDKLARKFNVHPNLLRGLIRSARHNSTIYNALRNKGYSDHEIPRWFARSNQEAQRREVPRRLSASAVRSDAEEAPSDTGTVHMQPYIGVEQNRNAEHFRGLSARSAPPAYTYQLIQLLTISPENPLMEEMRRRIKELQEEEIRHSLDRIRQRETVTERMSFQEFLAKAEVFHMMQQLEARNAAQMMLFMNPFRKSNTSLRIDIEKTKDLFTRPIEEIKKDMNKKLKDEKLLTAIGDFFKILQPYPWLNSDVMREHEEMLIRKRDAEYRAIIDLAKIIAEKRERKNIEIQILEDQNRRIMEDFQKYIHDRFSI